MASRIETILRRLQELERAAEQFAEQFAEQQYDYELAARELSGEAAPRAGRGGIVISTYAYGQSPRGASREDPPSE